MNEVTILVYKDGNQICALFGDNLQEGTVGIGDTIPEALTNLAKEMEEEGITEEIDSWL